MSAKIAFVLAATAHGPMIVPRLDYGPGFPGVGGQVLDTGSFDPGEVQLCVDMLRVRRERHGSGVVALDGGANVGAHTMAMAKAMEGWGKVAAFEAQERIYYALCGNIALNNLTDVQAWPLALSLQRMVSPRHGAVRCVDFLVSVHGATRARRRHLCTECGLAPQP